MGELVPAVIESHLRLADILDDELLEVHLLGVGLFLRLTFHFKQ